MTEEQLFPDKGDNLDPDKVLAHLENPAVIARWQGSLREMFELAERALRDKLDSPERAAELARHVVFTLCDTMGGSIIYLPRASGLKRAMRDADIFQDWRHKNATPSQLARKHRIAIQSIYAIIARQRALHRKQEPDLFGYDEGTVH